MDIDFFIAYISCFFVQPDVINALTARKQLIPGSDTRLLYFREQAGGDAPAAVIRMDKKPSNVAGIAINASPDRADERAVRTNGFQDYKLTENRL